MLGRRGRRPRISDQLRRAVIEEAEKELAGLDLETILATEPSAERSEAERLADLQRLETAMLLNLLRPDLGAKNGTREKESSVTAR